MSVADAFQRAIALAREPKLLCIVGPTASGKTDLALEVCEAVSGEVISADSVQIYRGFDIGSGKPTAEELTRAPHRLLDAVDPMAPIDAASWARLAEQAIADVRARGKVPIVCGGTFFWVRALVLGLVEAPGGDVRIRERHRALAEAEGRAALHAELAKVDAVSAGRLHPNDLVRVSRALEVFELSGRMMSALHAEHGFRGRRHEATMIGLAHDTDQLTARIAARVERWLAAGWLAEVKGLIDAGFGDTRPMGSVGYAELRAHVRGELPEAALAATIVRATRTFAKRQRTWLQHANVEWL